jgi:hypothetical protein
MTKYKLFNPTTGLHETLDSIETLKIRREELINSWMINKLQEAKATHSVICVNTNESGNELWVAVDVNSL